MNRALLVNKAALLANKAAIVTGAAAGIGLAISSRLLLSGATFDVNDGSHIH